MASTSEIQTPSAAMLKKVVYVAVLVSDQDKALDFYTTVIASRSGVTTRHPTNSRQLSFVVRAICSSNSPPSNGFTMNATAPSFSARRRISSSS
jgi:hypothetical protein